MPRIPPLVLPVSLLIGAVAAPLAAQSRSDDRWQVTLDGDRYLWDIRLVELAGDSLVVRQADSLVRVPVAQVTEVRLIRKTSLATGDGGAAVMSALMGGNDEVYDLAPLEFAERTRAIRQILLKHPPR